MQFLEQEDDDLSPTPRVPFKRHSSFTCGVSLPLNLNHGLSRKSFSYDKLPQEPLRLTVLKLDRSSFEIEVAKMATIAELKLAVEAAFIHMRKEVSWSHVWGQFCLCYDGHKLLSDTDYIGLYGIKDGDKLCFVRHTSINYNIIKKRSESRISDAEQPSMSSFNSDSSDGREKNNETNDDYVDQENLKHQLYKDDNVDGSIISRWQYNLTHLFRRLFSHQRMTNLDAKSERKNSSSRFSVSLLGNFINFIPDSSDEDDYSEETRKGF